MENQQQRVKTPGSASSRQIAALQKMANSVSGFNNLPKDIKDMNGGRDINNGFQTTHGSSGFHNQTRSIQMQNTRNANNTSFKGSGLRRDDDGFSGREHEVNTQPLDLQSQGSKNHEISRKFMPPVADPNRTNSDFDHQIADGNTVYSKGARNQRNRIHEARKKRTEGAMNNTNVKQAKKGKKQLGGGPMADGDFEKMFGRDIDAFLEDSEWDIQSFD